MTYEEAFKFVAVSPKPNTISCKQYPGAYQKYQQKEGASIVPEVC